MMKPNLFLSISVLFLTFLHTLAPTLNVDVKAIVSKVDLGGLEAACPLIPPEDDKVCGDNPDPPEVTSLLTVVMLVVMKLEMVMAVKLMVMLVVVVIFLKLS